jgi:tetratricopeptide (TPR) repeat protein
VRIATFLRFLLRMSQLVSTSIGLCCGVVAATVLAIAFTTAAQSAGNTDEIADALRAHQFDNALQLLRPELARSPQDLKLWTLEGIALSGKGDKKEALAAYRKALGFSPDYLPALEGAAQIEYETGDNEASQDLQRILQHLPNDPTSHAMLAVLEYRRGDCTAAVKNFEESGALLDSQPKALQQYGDCLIHIKEVERAISVFEREVAQANDDSAAYLRLASAQLMARRPKDAIATLQPLLQNNRANSDVLDLLASAYEADGNTPDAVRALRQAIVADPRNVDLYVDFANLSMDHQSYQVGVDMINAGIALQPKAAPLYVARGILYVQLAQYDRAEDNFEKADELDPKRSMGSAAEGLVAVQENDPNRALATVRAKLRKSPHDAFLLYLKAQILTERGPDTGSADFRDALESAKRATTIDPSLGAARDVLAKLYIQAGQNEAAIEQCRKALHSDPKDQTALYHLIQALRKSGKTKEIPELLKQLAELRADSTKKEAEHNRYKLVEQQPASTEKIQP